ncbi:helix-turn-helix transcriptional regulator [Collinsella sp. AK_207A]|nr:helix-turn-helix transcriptional regulator [Collinsella sp. AK_207A]
MTKAEFCNYAIVSRPFLDAMESGRSNITLDYLVYIARSLGMEPWELIR